MKLRRAFDRASSPWRNGGGETCEVAVFPQGAGWNDFHWRLSIATIRQNGPFSVLPGIERSFAVLDGAVALTIDGVVKAVQYPRSPAVRLDGGATTVATLVGGPALALNLMVRKTACRASLTPLDPAGPGSSEGRRIFIATVPFVLGETRLAALDALFLAPNEELPLLAPDARGWIIRIG